MSDRVCRQRQTDELSALVCGARGKMTAVRDRDKHATRSDINIFHPAEYINVVTFDTDRIQ